MLHPHIETFITVADEGSFSKAAQSMYLSKVSIMKQIDSLEAHLGFLLFERTNHGVLLTSAGKSFYKDARKLQNLSTKAIQTAREISGKESYTIKIGTSVLRSCKPLLDIWSKIDDGSYPFQIEIVPFDDNPSNLNNVFFSLGNDIDMIYGGIGTKKQMDRHQFIQMQNAKCCIAMSKKHPLASRKQLTWKNLYGETMLLVKQGSNPVLDAMRTEIEKHHPDIHLLEIQNPYDVSVFNECEKMGYIMETLDIWSDIHPSLITLPMEWDYEIPVGIMYSAHPTPAAAQFIELITK